MKDYFIVESKNLFGVCYLDGNDTPPKCIVEYRNEKGGRKREGMYKVEWRRDFITCERDIPQFYA